jgi:hypothetical protein
MGPPTGSSSNSGQNRVLFVLLGDGALLGGGTVCKNEETNSIGGVSSGGVDHAPAFVLGTNMPAELCVLRL